MNLVSVHLILRTILFLGHPNPPHCPAHAQQSLSYKDDLLIPTVISLEAGMVNRGSNKNK